MSFKLLTEHHLEFLSLKGGCTGSSEFTLVKMPYCWKSHVAAKIKWQFMNYIAHGLLILVYGLFMAAVMNKTMKSVKNLKFMNITSCS